MEVSGGGGGLGVVSQTFPTLPMHCYSPLARLTAKPAVRGALASVPPLVPTPGTHEVHGFVHLQFTNFMY